MNIPNKFLYTKEHEWADFSGKDVTIGITEFAQSQLGDIVFLEFPEIGDEITQDRREKVELFLEGHNQEKTIFRWANESSFLGFAKKQIMISQIFRKLKLGCKMG